MNTAFEKTKNSTDEWYTPKYILDALGGGGKFDLDPCAPICRLWDTAQHHYTKEDDGLTKQWFGRVWLNPPYSRPLIEKFVAKLAEHGNGIALLFNRCDSQMFHEYIFSKASAMLFLRGRIKFYRADRTQGMQPGCGSILIAYGETNAKILRDCGLDGKYIKLNT